MNTDLAEAVAAAGLAYREIAEQLHVDPKTVERWVNEDGRLPYRRHRKRLAVLLGRSEEELWPSGMQRAGLDGDWWLAWEAVVEGDLRPRVQPVEFDGEGESIRARALGRDRPVREGGHLWHAELLVWEREFLLGWYASVDLPVRSAGTLCLRLQPIGVVAVGRRVGLAEDGALHVGWAVLAREEHEARSRLEGLLGRPAGMGNDIPRPGRGTARFLGGLIHR